ncbi:thiamine phosphate synthase [Flavobacterium sp.]|uniref:thiamine phosphate synthase n=1 Tax=Flavobacterium sp. TaxID=239 RepID=UPI003753578E
MIVITNAISIRNEINTIHSLFAEGLMLLHIRKPDFSEKEMKVFLSEIKLEYRNKLVLHSHHHLAVGFGINRLHVTGKNRVQLLTRPDRFLKPVRCKTSIASTSIHSIQDFNTLSKEFDYAFLSPIYPSISKPDYISNINHFEAIKKRTNFSTKLVALGGVSLENIQQTLENGFDDIALLGSIWNSNRSIENFKKCQQITLSY